MQRTPLKILELRGSPTDIAFQMGHKRKHVIEKRVSYWNRQVDELFQGRREELKSLEAGFLKASLKGAPHYLDEIKAIAEGSGLPFADLFRLNLTELRAFAEKCTTLIFPLRNQSVLLAHNEDWNPERNDVFILKAHLPDLSYLVVAYDGYLPGLSCGFNSEGLYHAINYVPAPDLRVGLPRIFITRHLVTGRSFQDCTQWMDRSFRAFGQSIHLACKDRYLGIELTAKQRTVRRPGLPTAHSNHYLSSPIGKKVKPSDSSRLRQEVAMDLLKPLRKKSLSAAQAANQARRILSDRSCWPYALWREADTSEDPSATLVMAVMNTRSPSFQLFRRRPVESSPLKISL